ncbi:L-glutaminase [Agromyces sp. CF514]|uniref:glutaminase A n=1 Tax=Agromyces sp. CF514 TaxID=1881031 RepID=UPI0008F41843|nr:glutaminase A [Agromyces sp. CF514]SFR84686.1 L-glutaminase [Agromyces sp. CF514]
MSADESDPSTPSPLSIALASVLDRARPKTSGAVASYIPELALEDPEQLGIALASVRGTVHEAGDSDARFTIQSVSKPFVFALTLEQLGLAHVTRHVGLEPSGEPFNAISLDEHTGRPLNPMINAGAIVTSSLVRGDRADDKFAVISAGLSAFAGRTLDVDEAVYASEQSTGDRNRALAYLARSAGTLASTAEVATTAYFRQCSLVVTARDLAIMAATLANGGVNPVTRERVVGEDAARWTTAVMTSCGMYDASGEWLVRVGLPAKSGVGGGIAALQPEQFGIGTFSPRLDPRGNSVRGIAVLEELSERHGLHMLEHRDPPLSPIDEISVGGAGSDREVAGDEVVAMLRGDLNFAAAEEVLARLMPLLESEGRLVLDFGAVTRVGGPAVRLLRWAVDASGRAPDGRPRVELRDPDGVLDVDLDD